MTFGRLGEDYTEPAGSAPIWSAPESPGVAAQWAESLRCAYAVAERHARTLTRSSRPPAQLATAARPTIQATTWTAYPCGRGRPYLPLEVSHVVLRLVAEVFVVQTGTVDVRLVVRAGASTDTGLAISTSVSTAAPAPRTPDPTAPTGGPFAVPARRIEVTCEVALANVTAGQRVEIEPQWQGGSTNAIAVVGAWTWWEARNRG